MTGPYERALGEEFAELHPALARRYGIDSETGRACVGRGSLSIVSRNPLAVPALAVAARRHLLFPEQGTDVPFTAWSIPFRDPDGVESLALIRRFEIGPGRRFDATFRYDEDDRTLTDNVGTGGHLAVTFHATVVDGGLRLLAGQQYVDLESLTVPVPDALGVDVRVDERYDPQGEAFHVTVTVSNRLLGPVVHYRGTFEVEYVDVAEVPPEVRPASGGSQP